MTDFLRQSDTPLFPDVFWNLPTLKSRGGRLLIIGGHKQQFDGVQAIYQIAEAAGIGELQAAMPDSLQRLVGGGGFGHFLPTSASGSLGRAALGELLHLGGEYDGMVLGANLTNNSETGILVESLLRQYDGRLIITSEVVEVLKFHPDLITGNPRAVVVVTMPGLFALANHHHLPIAIKPNRGVIGKIEIIKQLASISRCSYVVFDNEVIVASDERISLTSLENGLSNWTPVMIGLVATFWLQQGSKPFEGLNGAALVARRVTSHPITTFGAASTAIRMALQGLAN